MNLRQRDLSIVGDPPEPIERQPQGWGDSYILWLEDECKRLTAELAESQAAPLDGGS